MEYLVDFTISQIYMKNLNIFFEKEKRNCGPDLIWPGHIALGRPRSSEGEVRGSDV
jgi:hypothetical protein